MASLDNLEGDALELAALLIVLLVIAAIVLAYMGSKGLLNWLLHLLKMLEHFLNKLFSAGGGKTFLGGHGGASAAEAGGPSVSVQNANPLSPIPLIPFDWSGASPNDFLVTSDVPGSATAPPNTSIAVQAPGEVPSFWDCSTGTCVQVGSQ